MALGRVTGYNGGRKGKIVKTMESMGRPRLKLLRKRRARFLGFVYKICEMGVYREDEI